MSRYQKKVSTVDEITMAVFVDSVYVYNMVQINVDTKQLIIKNHNNSKT